MTVFFCTPVWAGSTVTTPFQALVPHIQLQDILQVSVGSKPISGSTTLPIADMNYTSPYTVKISGINLKINYAFPTPEVSQGIWKYKSEKMSAELAVQRIYVYKETAVHFGGVTTIIRVEVQCDNVKLNLPEGESTVQASTQVDLSRGNPAILLQDFTASWTPGAWKVSNLVCTGPKGSDKLVSKAIDEKLHQIDPYLETIREQIKKEIANQLRPPLNLSIKMAEDVSMRVQLNAFELRKDTQTTVSGTAQILFANVNDEAGCQLTRKKPKSQTPPAWTDEETAIALPLDSVRAIVTCLHKNNNLHFSFNSTNIKPFRDLQHDGMQKAWVWPDLNHFSEDDIFDFELETADVPSFTNARASEQPHTMALDGDLPVLVHMLAPKGEDYIPYLHIYTDLNAPVLWTMADGEMRVLFASSLPLQILSRWDPDYLLKYATDQNIWWEKITDALRRFLTETGLSVLLPVIPVSSAITLSPKDGDLVGSNVHVTFNYENKNSTTVNSK